MRLLHAHRASILAPTMLRTIGLALFAGLLAIVALEGSASAQAGRRRGEPRIIQLDEIRIEGRVQKPNAFYILNRSNLGYEVLDLRTSFVREVVRTVQDEPF